MNIIGTIDLGIKLDLNKIKTHKDAEYNPNKFPGLVYRLKNPKTSYLLLENGKIICTGAKSEEELNLGIESLLDILEEKDIFEDYESIDMDLDCQMKPMVHQYMICEEMGIMDIIYIY
ncbi:hypothetical protein HON86_00560 [Candidatus Woesearchaeota archaeon]|nr:hypothetical protein [Candidatus Woesearchaeota archaeon]